MNINKALFVFIKIAFSVMVALLVIYGTVRLCRIGYDYGFRLYTEPAMAEAPGEDIMVQVKEGMSNRKLSEVLEEKQLIRDSELFYVQLLLSDYRNRIKPGVYTLNTSMEPKELILAMVPEEDASEAGTQNEDNSDEGTGTEDDSEEDSGTEE